MTASAESEDGHLGILRKVGTDQTSGSTSFWVFGFWLESQVVRSGRGRHEDESIAEPAPREVVEK